MTTAYYTRRPASRWATANDAATVNQVNAIDGLLASREIPPGWLDRIAALRADGLTKAKASEIISKLGPLPWKRQEPRIPAQRVPAAEATVPAPTVDVPAGYYALGTKVDPRRYRVTKPTTGRWVGRTFIAFMNGNGGWDRILDRTQQNVILTAIADDVHRAEMLYAATTGNCYKCTTELTDPISVHNGIGPTCAKKYGIYREPAPIVVDGEVVDEDREAPVRVVAIVQLALPAAPDPAESRDADERVWDAMIQDREAVEGQAVAEFKMARDPFDTYTCEVCGRGPKPGMPLLVGLRAWVHAGRCERDELPTAELRG